MTVFEVPLDQGVRECQTTDRAEPHTTVFEEPQTTVSGSPRPPCL